MHDFTFIVATEQTTNNSYAAPDGHKLSLDVPAGAVNAQTTIGLDLANSAQAVPADARFAGIAFSLTAYQNGTELSSFTFNTPITLTLDYLDSDVAQIDESELTLFYFDAASNTWKNDGISVISRDPANNRIVLSLIHFTNFGLFESTISKSVYLPLVSR